MIKIKHDVHVTPGYNFEFLISSVYLQSSRKIPGGGLVNREKAIEFEKSAAEEHAYREIYGDLQDKILAQIALLHTAMSPTLPHPTNEARDTAQYAIITKYTKKIEEALLPDQCIQREKESDND